MRIKVIFAIVGVLFLAAVTMIVLISVTESPNKRKNGFTRRWLPKGPVQIAKAKFPELNLRLVGVHSGHVYVCGKRPSKLWILSANLVTLDSVLLGLPSGRKLKGANEVIIDSFGLKILANNYGEIYTYGSDQHAPLRQIKIKAPLVSRIASLLDGSMVIRAFNQKRDRQIFQIIDSIAEIKYANMLWETTEDGGLSTDGILCYDSSNSQIYYVQAFQNRYIAMSKELQLLYEANTIDTTHTNTMDIKIFKDKYGSSLKSATPVINVNLDASANSNKLYIISGVKSDNETVEDFENNTVIDVYNGKTGTYYYSFHIPNIEKSKITGFQIKDSVLFAVYRSYMAKYQIPSP